MEKRGRGATSTRSITRPTMSAPASLTTLSTFPRGRGSFAVLSAAIAIAFARLARADPPEPTELPVAPPASLVWHPWRTFDPHLARREVMVSVGPVLQRTLQEEDGRGGFDATFG